MADFFRAIDTAALMKFTIIAANTMARPEAIYQLQRGQYDPLSRRLRLNPPGRVQTKKHRPIIPVSNTLGLWLDLETDPNAYFVSEDGEAMKSLRSSWTGTVRRAGLTGRRISPYSFRHGLARLVRRRGVSLEEVGLFMGHRRAGAARTTERYAPDDPSYLLNVTRALDDVMAEVQELAKMPLARNPAAVLSTIQSRCRVRNSQNRRLTKLECRELHELLRKAALTPPQLAIRFGITTTAVYKHMRKLGIARTWARSK
jgi:hypothetical protein